MYFCFLACFCQLVDMSSSYKKRFEVKSDSCPKIYFHQAIPQFDILSNEVPKTVSDLGSTKYSDRCTATIYANGNVSLHIYFVVKIHPLLLDSTFNHYHKELLGEVIAHEFGHVKQLTDILESDEFSICFDDNIYKGTAATVLTNVLRVIQLKAMRACNGDASFFLIEFKSALNKFLLNLLLTAYDSVYNSPNVEHRANEFAIGQLGPNAKYVNGKIPIKLDLFSK